MNVSFVAAPMTGYKQGNFLSSNIWKSFHVPVPARREHFTPLVKGGHVPMIVDVIGLLDTQSTLSGSGIKFWCSVHYPPFNLEVDSFIFQLPDKLWQCGTLPIFWVVHTCPMSRISAFECLRSRSYEELNYSILSDHLSLIDHILFSSGHWYCVQTQTISHNISALDQIGWKSNFIQYLFNMNEYCI